MFKNWIPTITVGELRKALEGVDEDRLVVIDAGWAKHSRSKKCVNLSSRVMLMGGFLILCWRSARASRPVGDVTHPRRKLCRTPGKVSFRPQGEECPLCCIFRQASPAGVIPLLIQGRRVSWVCNECAAVLKVSRCFRELSLDEIEIIRVMNE